MQMKKPMALLLCLGLLCGALAACGQKVASAPSAVIIGHEPSEPEGLTATSDESLQQQIDALLQLMENQPTLRPVEEGFLRWCVEEIGPAFAGWLLDAITANGYSDGVFHSLFGQSLLVLYDRYTGAIPAPNVHERPWDGTAPATLAFTGDINLADDWENMVVYHRTGKLENCITQPLLSRMQRADVLLVNNEFTFSDRGTAMPGKLYTFRAATANVELLHGMGADIVSLANNHVHDYGQDAFFDTLDTLDNAAIPRVGAGRDIDEAMAPQYFIAGGFKIAYLAASRAEKYVLTPEATADTPGVLYCYDGTLLAQAVADAKQNADLVIVYPHWGTENTHVLEDVQVQLAHDLIDVGADLIVGAHPHVLQGIEYYNGVPIVYSLGNFWFNTDRVNTALLEVDLMAENGQPAPTLRLVPCLQTGGVVSELEGEDGRYILEYMQEISEGVTVDADGIVHPQ